MVSLQSFVILTILLLNYLNEHNTNIKFTMECKKNGTSSFLDLNILRFLNNLSFVTFVIKKPTFIELSQVSLVLFFFRLN